MTVRSTLTSKIPSKKGKASTAEEGEINLISLSSRLKDSPKILEVPEEITAAELTVASSEVLQVPVVSLTAEALEEKASSLLENNHWRRMIASAFTGILYKEGGSTKEQKQEADLLCKILHRRLLTHMHRRIVDKKNITITQSNGFVTTLPSLVSF